MSFIKLSEKIFQPRPYSSCIQETIFRDCRCLIVKHLEGLTSHAVTYCTSLVSLKEMMKLFLRVVDEFTTTSDHADDAWLTLNNALFMILKSQHLQGIVTDVVKQMSDLCDESGDDILKKSILRGVTIVLMKCGKLLKVKGMTCACTAIFSIMCSRYGVCHGVHTRGQLLEITRNNDGNTEQ